MLKFEDMAPMANPAKVIGEMNKVRTPVQGTAADLAAQYVWTAEFDGTMGEALAVRGAAVPASDENMTVDLLKNGVSILSAVGTLDEDNAVIDLPIDPSLASFVAGDVFTVTRDYTAGAGATPMVNTAVVLKPTLHWWKT